MAWPSEASVVSKVEQSPESEDSSRESSCKATEVCCERGDGHFQGPNILQTMARPHLKTEL